MVESDAKPHVVESRSIRDLELGDAVKVESFVGLQYVPIPKKIAYIWFAELYPDTAMCEEGITPDQRPMKYWQEGFGVVVGKVPTIHGRYKLNILHKGPDDEYALLLSRNEFPVKGNI